LISIANEIFKGNIREMAMYDLIRAAVVLGQKIQTQRWKHTYNMLRIAF
jgi:hypothetical protein